MQVTVTFRHVEPTPALRAYAEEKLARVKKYLRRPVDAHVILSVAKERHVAEITLKADHVTMFAQEQTHDLYSAIDLAIDKLDHQAQRLHERRRRHSGSTVRAEATEEPAPARARTRGRRDRPDVIRTPPRPAERLSIDEAVAELDESGAEFLVFRNASNQMLAVLYRRRDGKYGLIEPE